MASKAGKTWHCSRRIPGPGQGTIDEPGDVGLVGRDRDPGFPRAARGHHGAAARGGADGQMDGCTWRAGHDFHPSCLHGWMKLQR